MGERSGGSLRGILAAISTVLLLASGSLWAGPAGAVEQPAKIVFANGYRIVSMNADATDRQILTRKRAWPGSLANGSNSVPVGSPDGKQIVFSDSGNERKGERNSIKVIGSGGGPARIVISDKGSEYTDAPEWSPDGSKVYAARTTYGEETQTEQILAVNSDGSGSSVIWSDTFSTEDEKDYADAVEPVAIEASPDGQSLLVTFHRYQRYDDRLELVDIKTGARQLIKQGAGYGSWSPDGSKIVYETRRNGEVAIMNADGTGSSILLPGIRNYFDSRPDWSPDGSRITIAREIDEGGLGEGTQIWSITPAGECLTRLTNGTPYSDSPTWLALPESSTDPGGCGDRAKVPLVEIRPTKRLKQVRPRPYWVGPAYSGGMLTAASRDIKGGDFDYEACSLFIASDCPGFFGISTNQVCLAYPYFEDFLRMFRFRGAIFMQTKDGHRAYVYTGGSKVDLNSGIRRTGVVAKLRMALQLRPLGGREGHALPPAVFPKRDVRRANRAVRLWKESRSLEPGATTPNRRAVALGYLDFGRALRRMGPVKTVGCKGIYNDLG